MVNTGELVNNAPTISSCPSTTTVTSVAAVETPVLMTVTWSPCRSVLQPHRGAVACKRGTRQVSLGSNGPEMCIRYETGTTDDPEHDNVTSLQGSRYEETTEKTTISASNDTTSWDLDSSLANDTLSYNLAENQSIVGPIAGAAGSLLLVIIGAIAWKNSHHSTQKKG
ncbi:uncharacterized protein LOC144881891 [Branchiostoma floridae x Branchiostoma japonicum]